MRKLLSRLLTCVCIAPEMQSVKQVAVNAYARFVWLQKPIYVMRIFTCVCACMIVACASKEDKLAATPAQVSEWLAMCSAWDDWDKPGPPFRIYGNTYYVGTCGITAILVAGTEGHILIDGATEAGAEVIAANIESLGFLLSDVKVLLHSHEHFDHVAGVASLQKRSGARLLASAEAAPVLNTGISSERDPQAGLHKAFPPARVDAILEPNEVVTLGELSLRSIATPGHTLGALSWQWRSCEDSHCLSIVYADSLSPISADHYHFSDHPEHVSDYRIGLRKLAELPCDVLVSPHPSASKMLKRLAAAEGLVDSSACAKYARKISHKLNKRLAKEE